MFPSNAASQIDILCELGRPCQRCIHLRKEDTCVDVRHKKRGRPRIHDESPSSTTRSSSGSASSSATASSSSSTVALDVWLSSYPTTTSATIPQSGPRPEYVIHYSPNFPPPASPAVQPLQLSQGPMLARYSSRNELYIIAHSSRQLQIVQMSDPLRTRIGLPRTLTEVLPSNPARDQQIMQVVEELGTSSDMDDESATVSRILHDTSLEDLVLPILTPQQPSGTTPLATVAREINADSGCVVFFVRTDLRGRMVEYIVARVSDDALDSRPRRRGFGLGDILA
ncbi:hypothetical protein V1509DRAFT_257005 [Lipomyces kononenkoae]